MAVLAEGLRLLYVAAGERDRLDPRVIGWGWADEAAFVERHQGQGTRDPSAFLSIPLPARARLADCARALQRAPTGERGSPGPRANRPGLRPDGRAPWCDPDDLWRRLREEHRIEAPCWSWNGRPLLRVSVAAYNDEGDLRRLEAALQELL